MLLLVHAKHRVKLYSLCYTRNEAICSLLHIESIFMLIAIHDMKRHAHCNTWSEAFCSRPYKE